MREEQKGTDMSIIQFKLISFIFCILLFVSCGSNSREGQNDDFIRIPVNFHENIIGKTMLCTSQYIDTVEYINITASEGVDYVIGEISDICYVGDKYYILDRMSKAIYTISEGGIIESVVHSPGRGPDEYLSLLAFDVNPTSSDICVMDDITRRIQIYNRKGEFKRTITIDDIVRDMAVLPNGDFLLYTPDFMDSNRRGLWRLDSLGNFKEHHVYIEDDFRYGGIYPKYFTKINDSVVGLMGGEDYDRIYHITCDTVEVAYQIDIDIEMSKEVCQNELADLETEPGEVYTKNDYCETESFLHFRIQTSSKQMIVNYDKKNEEILAIVDYDTRTLKDDMGLYKYFDRSSNGVLFTSLPVGLVMKYLSAEFSQINEDSNPLIVKYRLKNNYRSN